MGLCRDDLDGPRSLLLDQFYVWLERISSFRIVACTEYLANLFSQFVVLLLNWAREYFADDYPGDVRRTPGVLSSALVKDCLRHGTCRRQIQKGNFL